MTPGEVTDKILTECYYQTLKQSIRKRFNSGSGVTAIFADDLLKFYEFTEARHISDEDTFAWLNKREKEAFDKFMQKVDEIGT